MCSINIFAEQYLASYLPTNQTASQRLSSGPLATDASGPVTYSTYLTDTVNVVLVNPTNATLTPKVEVAMSPFGPCDAACNQERTATDALLGASGPRAKLDSHFAHLEAKAVQDRKTV